MWLFRGNLCSYYNDTATTKEVLYNLLAIEVGDEQFRSDTLLTKYEFEWIYESLIGHEDDAQDVTQGDSLPNLENLEQVESAEDNFASAEIDEQEDYAQRMKKRDFILRAKRPENEPERECDHWVMAGTCFTILLWDQPTKESMRETYNYASRSWKYKAQRFWNLHAHEFHDTKCESHIDDTQLLNLTVKFLRDDEKQRASVSDMHPPPLKKREGCCCLNLGSALHVAAEYDLDKVGSVLLEEINVDINFECGWMEQRTPLVAAARPNWSCHEKKILPLLFSHPKVKNTIWSIDQRWRDSDQESLQKHSRNPLVHRSLTSLRLAAMHNLGVISDLLQESSADVNIKDHLGRPPLSYTTGRNYRWHKSLPQLLTAPSIDIDLAVACEGSGVRDRIECFLQELGLENPTIARNLTPLHLAAIMNDEEVANTLLEQFKMDANARDSLGRTPLWYAVGHKRFKVLKSLLLAPDVDITSVDKPDDYSLGYRIRQPLARPIPSSWLKIELGEEKVEDLDDQKVALRMIFRCPKV